VSPLIAVISGLAVTYWISIKSIVTLRRVRLVLGRVTVGERVNHLSWAYAAKPPKSTQPSTLRGMVK